MRYWLGVSNEQGYGYQAVAQHYWEMVMSKRYLIKLLSTIAETTFEERERQMVTDAADDALIFFDEYCRITGRSLEETAQLRRQLGETGDASLAAWANSGTRIELGNAILGVCEAQGYDADSFDMKNQMGIKLLFLLLQGRYLEP
jgi:hypothetical protein